jgi:hypothetical protein
VNDGDLSADLQNSVELMQHNREGLNPRVGSSNNTKFRYSGIIRYYSLIVVSFC